MHETFAQLPNLSKLRNLPGAYQEALRYVRAAFPLEGPFFVESSLKVVLAAGCLRNLLTGRPFKDLDIFVLGWDKRPDGEFAKLFGVDPGEQANSSGPIAWARVVKGDLGYDLIAPHPRLIPDVHSLLDFFDIGICRIAHTGNQWHIHQDFLDDLRDQVIKVRGLGVHTAQSVRDHVARLQTYYPNFNVDTSFLDNNYGI